MRVVARFAELGGDQLLELLGDVVLEHLGLLVDAVARHPQRLGEVGLDQPVVADHLERHPLPRRGQADPLVGDVSTRPSSARRFSIEVAVAGVTPSRSATSPFEDEPVALAGDRVDRLCVVLDRLD